MMTADISTSSAEAAPEQRRTVSISVPTLAWAAATALLAVAVVILSVLLIGGRRDIADRNATADDTRHAEQVATDYAVGAATVHFDDFDAWVGRLKAGTAPSLATKFDATAPKLQEILTPLHWASTAVPIAAKVLSTDGGTYQVDVFLNVSSTNVQNPGGAQTTVTYTISIDRNSDWKITDVGGMDAALPTK